MMNEPVSTIMTRELITANADDRVSKVYELLCNHRIHHVPVVDGDKLVGLLTTYDLFKMGKDYPRFNELVVRDVMTTKMATLEPSSKVGTAAEIFLEQLFHALPIVENGDRLVGIVTTHDVLKYNFRKAYPHDSALESR